MRFRLYINEKHIGDGVLDVTKDGTAMFGCGEKILATMERSRLEFIAANGINLSGFAWTGKYDRRGSKVFRFVEWWMPYAEQHQSAACVGE